MKPLFIISIVIIALATYSCKNSNSSSNSSKTNPAETSSSATQSSSSSSATPANTDDANANELMDTTKLKGDMNDMLNSVISGKPDTTKLKKAASDIMTTDANMLSDSGIDKMYGNSNDPAAKAAADALKKARNGMGLTPGKLDSMRKEAAALQH